MGPGIHVWARTAAESKKEGGPLNTKYNVLRVFQKKNLFNLILILCGIIGLVVLSVIRPQFMTGSNIANILVQTSALALMAFGQTFVLVSGGIDLSIPSVMTLSGVAGALAVQQGAPPVAGIFIVFGVALVCGAINGVAVSRFKMMPFVVTLTMMIMADGAALLLAQSRSIPVPAEFRLFGNATILNIPVSIIVMVVLCIILYLLLNKSMFGRWNFATGISRESANTCGIPTKLVLFSGYIISSIMAAFAALILTGRLGAASLSMASDGTSMDVICAAIIGGASISGGVGSILGALGGAFIISILQNVLNLFGANYFAALIIKAAVILIVTYIDTIKTRIRRSA